MTATLDGFVRYKRRSHPWTKAPQVTIGKSGQLGINKTAAAAIGKPARVSIMYRLDPPALAIAAVGDEEPDSYAMQYQGESATVNARGVTRALGLTPAAAVHYDAEIVDGVLVIDLTARPAEGVTANGNGNH